ncbi:FtsX-like permease family protein [Nostocoides veronense]|uniref:FtsX-like permease family protein n=1 Tax=Nostocoides veronense TaxID=330836 RepID=UPI0031D330B1
MRPFTTAAAWRRQARDVGPGVLLALVAALLAAFVALLPVAEDRAYDRALGDFLADAAAGQRDVRLSYNAGSVVLLRGDFERETLAMPTSPQQIITERAATILGPAASKLLGRPDFSATTTEFKVTGPGSSPIGSSREAMVRVQGGLNEKVRWDAGSLGTKPLGTVAYVDAVEPYRISRTTPVIPVVVPTVVATAWKITVGDRFALAPSLPGRFTPYPITVELTGTYTPIDANDPFWADEGRLLVNDVVVAWDGGTTSRAAFMVSDALVGPLGQALDAIPEAYRGFGPSRVEGSADYARGLNYEWRYVLNPKGLDLARARTIVQGIDAMKLESSGWAETRPVVGSGLADVLTKQAKAVTVTKALTAFVSVALTALGAIAAVLLVVTLGSRRAPAMRLQSARGASRFSLIWGLVLEVLMWVVPVSTVAAVVGWRLGAGRMAVLAFAPAVIAALAAALVARRELGTSRSDSTAAQAIRLLAELALIGGAYFAINTVRTRGGAISTGSIDWYAALTPILLAAAVGVVLLRLLPLPIRWAAGLLGRRRSVLGFLGLTRAARGGGGMSAALVGLVVAATLATFLGGLATSIQRERTLAAYALTGADLRIDARRVDDSAVRSVAAVPGITAAVPAFVLAGQLAGEAGSADQAVTVIGVDPAAYSRALGGSPIAFDAAGAGGTPEQLTAIASEPVRPTGKLTVTVQGRERAVTIGAVQPGLTRGGQLAGHPVLVLPWDAVLEGQPYLQPNTLFVMGSAQAIAGVRADNPVALREGVVDRREAAADIAARSLPTLVRQLFAIGLALAAAFTVLSLLVILALTRPERVAALLRMRVLGMPRRRDWVLAMVEVLPPAAVAIAGGFVLGRYLPRVMQSAIDLGPYAGSEPYPPISTPWWVAGLVAIALLLLTILAVLLDLARARATPLSAHLRAGEDR